MTTARIIGVAIATAFALNTSSHAQPNHFCTQTAQLLFNACQASVIEDGLVTKANCINISDDGARAACLDEMRSTIHEGNQDCKDQRAWRLDDCDNVGEGRYDPDISPALFDDPRNPSNPNPYFPIEVGNHWEYLGGGERNTVDIVDETKLIEGVRCLVARDLVFVGQELTELSESTDDWYAQAKDSTTWYFGEETKNFESFDGDDPRRPELVDIEGSFKTGRDHAKPGIIFLAHPHVGDFYFEEFSLANAEDVTEIASTTYTYGNDPELDDMVPRALVDHFCHGDCVVTKNFSLLEPDIVDRKYYARGIGVILEVEGEEHAISQLVDCSFDQRCHNLPQPMKSPKPQASSKP